MSPLIEYPLLEGCEMWQSMAAENSGTHSQIAAHRLQFDARGVPRTGCS
jgi:hypothetical protein